MLVREINDDCRRDGRARPVARDAVAVMLDHGIGSVVVTVDGDPTGIVTESDVLRTTYAAGRPHDGIPVSKAMSHPLVTGSETTTGRNAAKRLADRRRQQAGRHPAGKRVASTTGDERGTPKNSI